MTEAPVLADNTVDNPTPEPQAQVYEDYWGVDETKRHMLPDGKQYFEFKIMNEGDKAKFQRMTNTAMTVGRDQTATVKMDQANERHTLIKTCVTGWLMFKGNEPVAYSSQLLEKWLQVAPPKIVEDLEFAIRMANPWMQSDMPLDELYKERDRVEEMIKQKIEEEAGESGSANK